MIRVITCLILLFLGVTQGMASNVRVVREAKVALDGSGLIATPEGNVAEVKFSIAWDNSWRDDYNWDAVYVFLKYKRRSDIAWSHVWLRDQYHTCSKGYLWSTAKTTTPVNQNLGVFIYRGNNSSGSDTVEVKLDWMIANQSINPSDFTAGNIEYTVQCIEMVYVPKGPFWLGDGAAEKRFRTNYFPIPEAWDLIKNDGKLKFLANGNVNSPNYIYYSPDKAANHVNGGTRVECIANSWYSNTGDGSKPFWRVDFDEEVGNKKTVRYFGVSGVAYAPHVPYRPSSWTIKGSLDGITWVDLMEAPLEMADWTVENDSYPVPKAIKVDYPGAYRYYMIDILDFPGSYYPMASNISMTEHDLENKSACDAYMVTDDNVKLNSRTNLSDGGAGFGNEVILNANYPKGYEGFYAMKYEVSQEQYVAFLNKLLYNQQKTRTIGVNLDNLQAGDYVFGGNPSAPTSRNGIAVGDRGNNRMTFVNNLVKIDFSQANDGQTLACNFLTPSDMLAYADWTGLRPLSEMEYEKMCRELYPNVRNNPLADRSVRQAWAGGKFDDMSIPTTNSFSSAGTSNEKMNNVNVNIGGKATGPTRVGAFADRATSKTWAGASEWGIMELGGNLSEIYYNMTPAGQAFQQILASHGDGYVVGESASNVETGNTDMAVGYWPRAAGAFGLRGGSFKDKEKERAQISDRANTSAVTDMNNRASDVTFRLGRSYTALVGGTAVSYLTLPNGQKSVSTGSAIDSICRNRDFEIIGSELLASTDWKGNDVKKTFAGKVTYYWFISENEGASWKYIPGENGKDLKYNLNNEASDLREVRIQRSAVTPTLYSITSQVYIRVVDDRVEVTLRDTLNEANQVLGFLAEAQQNASYQWRWKNAPSGANPVLKNNQIAATSDFYTARRWEFNDLSKQEHTIECRITVAKKCVQTREVKLYIKERPKTAVASDVVVCGQMMRDIRDDSVYMTTKIGDQCWMAENLRYVLPTYSILVAHDPKGVRYGRFYNYHPSIVNTVCPAGWRMPSHADLATLSARATNGIDPVSVSLRAGHDWTPVTTANKATRGKNLFGFGALPGGHYGSGENGYCYLISSVDAYWVIVFDTGGLVYSNAGASPYYMSLRCIKN